MFRPTLALLWGLSLAMTGCGQTVAGVDISGGRRRSPRSSTKFSAKTLTPFGHGWKSAASMWAENEIQL